MNGTLHNPTIVTIFIHPLKTIQYKLNKPYFIFSLIQPFTNLLYPSNFSNHTEVYPPKKIIHIVTHVPKKCWFIKVKTPSQINNLTLSSLSETPKDPNIQNTTWVLHPKKNTTISKLYFLSITSCMSKGAYFKFSTSLSCQKNEL